MAKYVVVTGASSGIGYAAAKAFAARGYNLIVCARRVERLEALKSEILTTHPECDVVIKKVDLSDEAQVVSFYEATKPYEVEIFVNNAGLGNSGDITTLELEHDVRMMQVNCVATALLSSLYVGDYKDVEGAQLINISSIGGYLVVPGSTLYCASKFFVSALTEGIDLEMFNGKHPLRAKVLAPTLTETEFEQSAHESAEPVDYAKKFGRYHTAETMAEYLLALVDGDKTVGEIDFKTFSIKLSDAKLPAAGSRHPAEK